MHVATERKSLDVHKLYFERASGSYFWTPDCVGVFWLTAEEACHEFGDDVTAMMITLLED